MFNFLRKKNPSRLPPPTSSSNDKKNWLDLLPEPLFDQLACYLYAGELNPDLLTFAELGLIQQRATLSAISYKLIDGYTDSEAWVAVTQGHIREIGKNFARSICGQKELKQVLRSRSLQRATLARRIEHFRVLGHATNLQCLDINVGDHNVKSFLRTLQKLVNLKELVVNFEGYCQHLEDDPGALAASCPALEKLAFTSFMMDTNKKWLVIDSFKSLVQVTIRESVPKEAISKLRSTSSVRIGSFAKFIKLAKRVGQSVTAIENYPYEEEWFAEKADVESLSVCPYLSELTLCVLSAAVPPIVSIAKNLRALTLIGKDFGKLEQNILYEHVPAGSLVQIARVAENLEMLRVFRLKISRAEILDAFQLVAPKLKSFAVSLECQDELQIERLVWLLHIARKARNLETFEVEDEQVLMQQRCIRKDSHYYFEHYDDSELARVESALERLHCAAPRLDKRALVDRIDEMRVYDESSSSGTSSATDDFEDNPEGMSNNASSD